jgi:hypothetical protein
MRRRGGKLEGWGSSAALPFQKTIPSPEDMLSVDGISIGGGEGVGARDEQRP